MPSGAFRTMAISTYFLALLPAALIGLYFEPKSTGKGWYFPWGRLLGAVIFVEVIAAAVLLTYGYYIGSPLALLAWTSFALLGGLILDLILNHRWFPFLMFRSFGSWIAISAVFFYIFAPELVPAGPDGLGLMIWIIVMAIGTLIITVASAHRKLRPEFRRALPWAKPSLFFALLLGLAIVAGPVASLVTLPAGATATPIPSALTQNTIEGSPSFYVTNTSHIRVVSWDLATQYLRRAYGSFASAFEDDIDFLFRYTHPTMVGGDFAWVNAPTYESLKWLGNPQVPFFVLLKNLPENMTRQEPQVVQVVEKPLEIHEERIPWERRLIKVVNEMFSGELYIFQVRFDVDDDLNPFWILYMAQNLNVQDRGVLRKVVIVDAQTGAASVYDVDDPDIPTWLEVVYPDEYVYDWTSWWGSHRFGLTYGLVNKLHLYDPDDVAARFVVVGDTPYWQVPMVQQASRVLGGVVNINTRTGETFFFNLEGQSVVDLDTVILQVSNYLQSGAIGFQQLRIDEAYLYPFRMVGGLVRYAYVVPLYAGFTVQKYAIVDGEEYTAPPVIDSNLQRAVDSYRAKTFGQPAAIQARWENHTVENAFMGNAPGGAGLEIIITINGTTHIVTENQLGIVTGDSQASWRTLELAVSAWIRGEDVVIAVVILEGAIVDVYWSESTLVPSPWG